MTGGVGRKQLTHFYDNYFIPQMPPDTQIIPVSRTIGHDRLVDEFVIKFTHTLQMDWLLPGVPPTNKPVEVATMTVVQFKDGKMASERIYFDQASILVQLGLLDPGKLPVAGVATARKDDQLPSNELMKRTLRDEDLWRPNGCRSNSPLISTVAPGTPFGLRTSWKIRQGHRAMSHLDVSGFREHGLQRRLSPVAGTPADW